MTAVLAQVSWPILERIPLLGDAAVSPHGITIAIGFLAGAALMQRQARLRGVARRSVDDTQRVVEALMLRAALGGIIGARFFYVLTRLDQFPDPVSWFMVWEGGLSLLGGITGGVLAGLPYVARQRLSVPLLLDSAAPGLALGIFIGRVGDLIIGEHLGGQTDFFLGWRCAGNLRDSGAPYPWPGPTMQGCFDTAVHQTALYDFLAGGLVFVLLLALARRPRFDGFFFSAFVVVYGAGRFLSDFARAADKNLVGTLTGSQVAVIAAIAGVTAWAAVRRPWLRHPSGWSPPQFPHGWGTTQRRRPEATDQTAEDVPHKSGAAGE